ncbi:CPBP family intramembrane glutamic endopeptidase [Demequina globuliformis]|uniref:CPBP family intramembrane glutamic endopeptidase n=1 Tax=Demequina globuliformis TaxID=676202 RepID=UPI000786747C|nr:CPBP family intramembrane glutamic endopeptidase [Demequina globuliformis]
MATDKTSTSRVRVSPNLWMGLAVFLGYVAVMFVMWTVMDTDYEAVQDTQQNALEGIVIPVAVGAAFLVVATSLLGWWAPALREKTRNLPKWLLIVPILFTVGGAMSLGGADFGALELTHILTIGAGVLLVGFSEELVSRGILLTGARGTVGEIASWFITCLMFGLLHVINIAFGAPVSSTGFQILAAFLAGSTFYISRRVTGTLVVPMLMHALWDWGSLVNKATGEAPTVMTVAGLGATIGQLAMYLSLILVLFVAFRYDLDGNRKSKKKAETVTD